MPSTRGCHPRQGATANTPWTIAVHRAKFAVNILRVMMSKVLYLCSLILADALPEPVAVCNLDGNVYKEGEKFFPKESCSVCLCEKGFNGTIENVPYCRRRSCGVQLSHQEAVQGSCAPLYRKQTVVRCCPHAWVCRKYLFNKFLKNP